MLLSSLNRLRRYIMLESTTGNNSMLQYHLYAVSTLIENYLNRKILLQEYTQYEDVNTTRLEYSMDAFPITVLTSVYTDTTGLYSGQQTEQLNSYISSNSDNIVLKYPVLPARKGIRFIYTGGMAESSTISTYVLSAVAGTFTLGNYVTGQTTGAVGIVKNTLAGDGSIQIDNLYGTFIVGEVIKPQATEGGANIGSVTGTIASITIASLATLFPEICMACEMQVRYNWKHKDDYENGGVNKDSTTYQKPSKDLEYEGIYLLRPEVRTMINSFRRISL